MPAQTMLGRLKNFCQITSCHGFCHISTTTNKCGKVFWSFVLIVMFCVLLSSQVSLLSTYFGANESERWTMASSEISAFDLTHPTITVCNYNRIKKSEAKKYHLTDDYFTYLFSHVTGRYLNQEIAENVPLETIDSYTKWRQKFNLTYRAILEKMSHTCEDLIKVLLLTDSWRDRIHVFDKPCQLLNKISVKPVITYDLGVCQQLQVNPKFRRFSTMGIGGTGQNSGTSLLLDLQPEEYVDFVTNNFQDVGVAIQVSYNDNIIYGQWINGAPGLHTWIAMRQIQYKPGDAYNSLFFTSPCSDKPYTAHLADKYYSKEMCLYDCMMIPFIYCTKCYPAVEGRELPICELEVIDQCIPVANYNMWNASNCCREYKEKFDPYIKNCTSTCGDLCSRTVIRASVSTTQLFSEQQLPKLVDQFPKLFGNKTLSEIQKRYAMVDIYYNSGEVKIIEWRERTSLGTLLGTIGGQMGLFLGISFVTIIHAIVELFSALFTACSCRKCQ